MLENTWLYLSTQPVHGEYGPVVAFKVDEPVSGRFASELVGHDLDGDDALLPQGHHGVGQELLVHVRLEAAYPQGANASHDVCAAVRVK